MSKPLRNLRRLALYHLVSMAARLLRRVPRRFARRLGAVGGLIAHGFATRSRKRALEHLALAFGDSLSPTERRAVCRRMFAHLGMNGMEMLTLPQWSREEVEAAVDPCGGHAILRRELDRGRGAILLTGHFGNWELFGAYAALSYDLYVIAREIRFTKYDQLMNRMRAEAGLKVIYQSDSPRDILKVLRKGGVIAILPDQDIHRISGVFVEFFGRPAYTPTGPVAISLASGAPIIPVYLIRDGDRHRALLCDPIHPTKAGGKEKALFDFTQAWSRAFEAVVRRHPDHWAWMHKRWDTTPDKLLHRHGRETAERAVRGSFGTVAWDAPEGG